MLRDGYGVIGVIVISANLFHVQVLQYSTEYDVEQLHTVGILDHADIGDGQGGLGAIGRPRDHNGNSLQEVSR